MRQLYLVVPVGMKYQLCFVTFSKERGSYIYLFSSLVSLQSHCYYCIGNGIMAGFEDLNAIN